MASPAMRDAAVSAMLDVAPSVREAGTVTEAQLSYDAAVDARPSVRETGTATDTPSLREAGSTAAPTMRDAAASAVTSVIDQGTNTPRRQRPTLGDFNETHSYLHTEPIFNFIEHQRRAEAAVQAANAQIAEIEEFRRIGEAQIADLVGRTTQQAQQLVNQSNELDLRAARNRAADRRVTELESELLNEQIDSAMVYDSLQEDYHNLQTAEERAQQQLTVQEQQITQLAAEFVRESMNLADSKARTKSQLNLRKREKESARRSQAMLTRQMNMAQSDRFAARKVSEDYRLALARSDRALKATEVAARGYQKEAFDADVSRQKRTRPLPILKRKPRKQRWANSSGQTL